MVMSRGTREPPWGTSEYAPGSWLAGRILSGVVLAGVAVPFAVLATMVIGSATDPERDRHGYVQIFGTVFLIVLVVPLVLSVVSTILLLRRKRAGFIVLALAGCPFALALMTLTGVGLLLGLAAVVVMGVAITAFVLTGRSPATAPPPGAGPPPMMDPPPPGAGPPPTG